MTAFIIGGCFMSYMEYNKHKEEEVRKRGYPDGTMPYEGPGNGKYSEPKAINIRVILARCIYGMYYRVRDHPEYRTWWGDMHYDLVSNEDILGDDRRKYVAELQKEATDKYFGVLRRKPLNGQSGPLWIVAVRGTYIFQPKDFLKDAKIFLQILREKDFMLLKAVLTRLISDYGLKNVVLTGHSLGAAAGMLVGRKLAEEGTLVEAHLFNPPFATLTELVHLTSHLPIPLELRNGILEISDFLKKALIFIAVGTAPSQDVGSDRRRLRSACGWDPHLYINTHDPISSQAIEHFRDSWDGRWEWSQVDRIQPTNTFHLLPRAVVHISKEHRLRWISAHMLWNWALPELPFEIREVNLCENKHTSSSGSP